MASSRARRLLPVLALLVFAAGATVGNRHVPGEVGSAASSAPSLRATSPAVEAVLPFRPEQDADRAGHAGGSKHRLPLGLAVVTVGLAAPAVALWARRRPRLSVLQPHWFTVPSPRGPPLLPLVAT